MVFIAQSTLALCILVIVYASNGGNEGGNKCEYRAWKAHPYLHCKKRGAGLYHFTKASNKSKNASREFIFPSVALSSPALSDEELDFAPSLAEWALPREKVTTRRDPSGIRCEPLPIMRSTACFAAVHENSIPSCEPHLCLQSFQKMVDFVQKTAFLGAIRCRYPLCTCIWPGLTRCRTVDAVPRSIATFGDSTMRQFSFAWHIAGNDQELIDSLIRQQLLRLTKTTANNATRKDARSDLCRPDIKGRFEVVWGKTIPPKWYTPTFMNDDLGPPHVGGCAKGNENERCGLAVFNLGLHLLGGYVDPKTRWNGDLGSPEKAAFVKALPKSYPSRLREATSALKARFKFVIFKNTNTIHENKFTGEWKRRTDACARIGARRQLLGQKITRTTVKPRIKEEKGRGTERTMTCKYYLEDCIRSNSNSSTDKSFQFACRNLAFDSQGSDTLNAFAARTFHTRKAVFDVAVDESEDYANEHTTNHDHGKSLPFFTLASDIRQTAKNQHRSISGLDGFVDAAKLTRYHGECTDDGRHYHQLELVNVRVIFDAFHNRKFE